MKKWERKRKIWENTAANGKGGGGGRWKKQYTLLYHKSYKNVSLTAYYISKMDACECVWSDRPNVLLHLGKQKYTVIWETWEAWCIVLVLAWTGALLKNT